MQTTFIEAIKHVAVLKQKWWCLWQLRIHIYMIHVIAQWSIQCIGSSVLVFKQHDPIIKALVGTRKLSPFQNKGSTLENHDLPILIIKSELFINLLLLQNKASNVENSVAASWNLLPLVATGKTSLCSSPRYSVIVLSATYQQLNTHKDFTLFSTYLFNQYRYQ